MIDVLYLHDPNNNVVFTADNTVTHVEVSLGPADLAVFVDGNGNDVFGVHLPTGGGPDHVVIESAIVTLPHCFCFGDFVAGLSSRAVILGLGWIINTAAGGPYSIPLESLGGDAITYGKIHVHENQMEMPLGIFSPVPLQPGLPGDTTLTRDHTLVLRSISCDVSMIGVPDSLHETEQHIHVGLKVRHNAQLGT